MTTNRTIKSATIRIISNTCPIAIKMLLWSDRLRVKNVLEVKYIDCVSEDIDCLDVSS